MENLDFLNGIIEDEQVRRVVAEFRFVLVSMLITDLVEYLKKTLLIKAEYALAAICIMVGVVYATFKVLMPETFQDQVLDFVGKAGLGATLLYLFYLKKRKPGH